MYSPLLSQQIGAALEICVRKHCSAKYLLHRMFTCPSHIMCESISHPLSQLLLHTPHLYTVHTQHCILLLVPILNPILVIILYTQCVLHSLTCLMSHHHY